MFSLFFHDPEVLMIPFVNLAYVGSKCVVFAGRELAMDKQMYCGHRFKTYGSSNLSTGNSYSYNILYLNCFILIAMLMLLNIGVLLKLTEGSITVGILLGCFSITLFKFFLECIYLLDLNL